MTDLGQRQRQATRRAASGDVEARAAVLAGLVRSGRLARRRVALAAARAASAARVALPAWEARVAPAADAAWAAYWAALAAEDPAAEERWQAAHMASRLLGPEWEGCSRVVRRPTWGHL